MHRRFKQLHQLPQVRSKTGITVDSKRFPAKEPEKLNWTSSQSVNPTYLKMHLCHHSALQASIFQFTAELFLHIHQCERREMPS